MHPAFGIPQEPGRKAVPGDPGDLNIPVYFFCHETESGKPGCKDVEKIRHGQGIIEAGQDLGQEKYRFRGGHIFYCRNNLFFCHGFAGYLEMSDITSLYGAENGEKILLMISNMPSHHGIRELHYVTLYLFGLRRNPFLENLKPPLRHPCPRWGRGRIAIPLYVPGNPDPGNYSIIATGAPQRRGEAPGASSERRFSTEPFFG